MIEIPQSRPVPEAAFSVVAAFPASLRGNVVELSSVPNLNKVILKTFSSGAIFI